MGTQPVKKVELEIGNESKIFEVTAQSAFVAITPGKTRSLTAYYQIPANEAIANPECTVAATFADGAEDISETETIILNIPDIGIADSNVLRSAENGKRILQFTLYNNSDAELQFSGREVKLDIFSDPQCTTPVESKYFTEIAASADGHTALKTVSDNDDLAKIDDGSYTVQYSFDLALYIKQKVSSDNPDGRISVTTPYADANGEVRDGGVTLYAKVWGEKSGENGELQEYITTNNTTSIKLESLLKQVEEPVTISSERSENANDTTVVVTLQNNSIVQSQRGNVSVALLDADDNVLGFKQSFDTDGVLLTLIGEQKLERTFTFSGVIGAVCALVTYDQKVTGADDATLSFFGSKSVPVSLSNFVSDGKGNYSAAVTADDLTDTVVAAIPKSTLSKVAIASSTANGIALMSNSAANSGSVSNVGLNPGGTTIVTATVTAKDGTKNTYTLTITNRNSTSQVSLDDSSTIT